jgi:hypothetical protein
MTLSLELISTWLRWDFQVNIVLCKAYFHSCNGKLNPEPLKAEYQSRILSPTLTFPLTLTGSLGYNN